MTARLYPPTLPADVPSSERRVWEALARLPDGWRVFHGVAWQALRRGTPGDGEADFVLLHPDRGLVVVEVKGGDIRLVDGVWYTGDRRGSEHRIDPFGQATASKRALLAYLHETVPDLGWLPAGHAVWFPFLDVDRTLGPAAPAELILDHGDLHDPEAAVERVCTRWELDGGLDPTQVEAITVRLAPTVEIRHTLALDLDDIDTRIVELTRTQQRAFAGLRSARRVIVYGGAGTGKTVLAVGRARRLAQEGYRVLLTCFNRPLGDRLAAQFGEGDPVAAASFHRLAYRWADEADLVWPTDPTSDWWDDEAADLVVEAADRLGLRFDAVVVDEGQDFAPSWFLALEALLADPAVGQFVVFADPHQVIYRDGWEPPYDAVEYHLDLNVRNTRPIATAVAEMIGADAPSEGIDGPPVETVVTDDWDRLGRTVSRVVHRLVREEEVEPSSVVVLTQRRDDKDLLLSDTLAGLPTGELGSDAPIVVETIHRFKGLESDVAVVVLRNLEGTLSRTLAYIGMSRARAHLIVVGPAEVVEKVKMGASPVSEAVHEREAGGSRSELDQQGRADAARR